MPLFDNSTGEPLLGEIVSERMKAQLLAAGPWRVVGPGQAPELTLIGHVTRLKITPVAFDSDSRATEYQMEVHVNIILTNNSDSATVWSAPDLIGAADYYVDQNNVAASREEKERAFQDAGQRLAEQVSQQLVMLPVGPAETPAAPAVPNRGK